MPSLRAGKFTAILVAAVLLPTSLWFLVDRFQWRDAFAALGHTDFVRLIAAVWVIHFAYICVRTWRWQIVVRHSNPAVNFLELYWITAIVVSLAIVTPGQLGETLKTELLKRRGLLGRLPGLGGLAVERVLDLLVIAMLACIGLLFGNRLADRFPGFAVATVVLFLIGLASLYLLLRFDPGGRASNWLARTRTGSGSPKGWAMMALATILAWGLTGLAWHVSLLAVGVHLSFPVVLWLLSAVTLGTLLSFIPGGVGVADFLTVSALVNLGASEVSAQVGALILRTYSLIIIAFGLFHLLVWLFYQLWHRPRDSSHQG